MQSKIVDFLNSHQAHYETIPHARTYTAQETAQITHTPGREFAKPVILRVDGRLTMVVVPAQFRLDLEVLRQAFGASQIELASEQEFRDRFPECEVGAEPPFGNLYGMEVWIAESLTEDEQIAFNAGSHTELVRMPYADFANLVRPRILPIPA